MGSGFKQVLLVKNTGKACSRAGVARFVSGSGGFYLVSGLAFFQEIAAVDDFG
jgi:hypothetical protein